MRILGIDPGLLRTGYACLHFADGAGAPTPPTIIEAGVFTLPPKHSIARRLVELERDLSSLIARTEPDAAYVEKLFAHYKHPTTAITMGHARGVILLALQQAGLDPCELPSTEVKKSVTGNGHASKMQVQRSIQAIFDLPEPPHPSDVADAMAISLTGGQRFAANLTTNPHSSS